MSQLCSCGIIQAAWWYMCSFQFKRVRAKSSMNKIYYTRGVDANYALFIYDLSLLPSTSTDR
eukprot:1113013-Amorphochlora_amoeboformis.AAC.1